jgi:hypothetical protein
MKITSKTYHFEGSDFSGNLNYVLVNKGTDVVLIGQKDQPLSLGNITENAPLLRMALLRATSPEAMLNILKTQTNCKNWVRK